MLLFCVYLKNVILYTLERGVNMTVNDYYRAMLKEFFDERDLSAGKRAYELERNPYNERFMMWEQEKKECNIELANVLREQGFIIDGEMICEIGNHINNSISEYLPNQAMFHIPEIGKMYYNRNMTLLVKGITNGEIGILKKLNLTKMNVILCVCNKKAKYYERCTKAYGNILRGYDIEEYTTEEDGKKLYIAKTIKKN